VRDDSTEDGVRILSGQVAPNLDFRIEQSSLSGETPTWQTLATVQSDADGRIRYPVTTDSEKQFYRAVFSPPAP
jgi:5-hydroxyisourate hydrolase-like protein (transthyretin family)